MISAADLKLPVERGARLVALAYLDKAVEQSQRLTSTTPDAEALHDFRVAVRRLRSWIRAFEDELRTVRKRDRRRLKEIAQATNPGRDAEVQIEWLDDASGGIGKRRKEAAAWIRAILSDRIQRSNEHFTEVLGERFGKLHVRLKDSLGADTEPLQARPSETLGMAIADRMTTATHDMQHALDAVYGVTDAAPSHVARIAAKRLRYLIEPAIDHVEGGNDLLSQLKALQNDLGVLHDRHVMAQQLVILGELSTAIEARQRIITALGDFGMTLAAETPSVMDVTPPPVGALVALAERLRRDIDGAFEGAHDRWLEGKHRQLDEPLGRFASRLRTDFGA